ncbi:succinate dehydrogenase/fumarate reductase flavoprotein subunit [Pseudochelatococcus lubricantis]|uniref:Succinate dehydrogenase/fumarate reductase flavoprotein subunit n=1 Tax=Pseudochelatococcus lubricantis TaxID=1538102 RepID=A0ABX0V3P3_9HYPH|nr:FAD-binding protein [Pseudochelatococcus lubricantis]NIJ59159.1 succinate dehydrogenase/fumarate reductase flavoprotein subunit [Pseudochelatococcus lubricantis]
MHLDADVLVIGGGPAGCWAGLAALRSGASVVLVDKGYVGTSGAMAAGNNTVIDTLAGSVERQRSVDQRLRLGCGLADAERLERVMDHTRASLDLLAEWDYPFPRREDGRPYRGMLRGVDNLRFLRQRLIKGGARILDHSPADALLLDAEGAAAGATGFDRRTGARWRTDAGAVVIATGGCAFLSGAIGTHNLTGDGYLLGVEAGATLSGMEFSGQYGISPVFSGVTKGIIYFWATLTTAQGEVIDPSRDKRTVAHHLLRGPVYAVLDKASPRLQEGLRKGQPNIFVPFDRTGIDPFRDKFEITLRHEGTVRGTGGLLLTDGRAGTAVPGLFAAGDAASREPMSGATSGGGGPNAAWAIATGGWAGEDAAAFARALGPRARERTRRSANAPAPGAGASSRVAAEIVAQVVTEVRKAILPLDGGYFRTEASLLRQQALFDGLWRDPAWRTGLPGSREAEALLATARWVTQAALLREETRGTHRRTDRPQSDDRLAGSFHLRGANEPRSLFAPFAEETFPYRSAVR